MDKDETINCRQCIHYKVCALWSTSDLVEGEAHKGCFGHFANEKDYYKASEDIVIIDLTKNEKTKNDRHKLMDLLYKLKKGELCTPNCYGCCSDNELSFAYCPDVIANFEKEITNLGYRRITDDEIVIKKSEYENLLAITTQVDIKE